MSSKSSRTKRTILDNALLLINDMGTADFKIDTLATAINISPGNITYHYSKRDDIYITLWGELMDKLNIFDLFVSDLLDIRQMFLVVRAVNAMLWDYRGIVMIKGGHTRQAADGSTESLTLVARRFFDRAHTLLRANGYLEAESNSLMESSVVDNECLAMRAWLNYYFASDYQKNPIPENKYEAVDRASLMVLYALAPLFTERGMEEFDALAAEVRAGRVSRSM